MDCPEFCELLLYVGPQLNDSDIPHRTKMAELIEEQFQIEFGSLIKEIKVCRSYRRHHGG
jgi:hypothetical protein